MSNRGIKNAADRQRLRRLRSKKRTAELANEPAAERSGRPDEEALVPFLSSAKRLQTQSLQVPHVCGKYDEAIESAVNASGGQRVRIGGRGSDTSSGPLYELRAFSGTGTNAAIAERSEPASAAAVARTAANTNERADRHGTEVDHQSGSLRTAQFTNATKEPSGGEVYFSMIRLTVSP